MDIVGALFLVLVGAGVLAVAYRGHVAGELPAGASLLRPYRPNRDDNPFAFRFFLALYVCGGLSLTTWGLLILAGMAPPLKLQ